MQITSNGKSVEVADSISVTDLLTELKVTTPIYVTVELNGDILSREQWPDIRLSDGDTVEFLYFMGGGAR